MDIAFDEPTGTTDEGLGFVAASDTGFDMGFVESTGGFSMPQDEGLGGFGLSDEPAPEPAHEVYNPPAAESFSYSPPAPVDVAHAPVASMFAAPEAENPLTIWEAQHKIDLKEKAEREKVNNDKMRKDADAWLKQFSDERKKNHDLKHSDNQYVLLCPCDFFLLFSFFMLCFVILLANSSKCAWLQFLVFTLYPPGLTKKHLRKRWRRSTRQVPLGRA